MTQSEMLGQLNPATIPYTDYIEGGMVISASYEGQVFLYTTQNGVLAQPGTIKHIKDAGLQSSEKVYVADFRLQNDSGEEFVALIGTLNKILDSVNIAINVHQCYWVVRDE